jgi:hypothetical protein
MRAFIAKHWRALLLALGINWPSFWAGIKWLWDWAGRLDLVATHAKELRGFGGMVEFFTNPPPWTIFPTAIIGILIVLWDIRRPKVGLHLSTPKNRMLLFAGISAICLVASAAFGFVAYQQYRNPPPAPTTPPSELLGRAEKDFVHTGGVALREEKVSFLPRTALEVPVKVWVHSDLITMAKYVVMYVPQTFDMPSITPSANFPNQPSRITYEVSRTMADRYKKIMEDADAQGAAGTGELDGSNFRDSRQAAFTGTIYIYYEGNLTEGERVSLREYYKEKGAPFLFFKNNDTLQRERSITNAIRNN